MEDVSSITYDGVVAEAAMNTLVLETETGDTLTFTTTIAQKDLKDGLSLGMTVAVTCPFGYEPSDDQPGLAIQICQLESSSSGQEEAAADSQAAPADSAPAGGESDGGTNSGESPAA